MKKDVAVVIPYYHSQLTESERVSLENCFNVLKNYPIILVIPEKMSPEEYPPGAHVMYEAVPSQWLESVDSYNQMMVCKDFYERFVLYEYILIFQLDAFVFGDSLKEFCSYDYDYIGAPWINGLKYLRSLQKGVWYVGNGGLSLRRISAFLKILNRGDIPDTAIPEDVFWASCDSEYFRVAPVETALKFAFEKEVRQCFLLNHNKIPFGCHAWEKYDFAFWRPFFEERGYYPDIPSDKGMDNCASDLNFRYLEAEDETIQLCINSFEIREKAFLYIFGAGGLGSECCWLLRRAKVEHIRCIDNNKKLWGTFLWGVPVESPEALGQRTDNIMVMVAVSIQKKEILEQLKNKGYLYGQNVVLYSDLVQCIKDKIRDRKIW